MWSISVTGKPGPMVSALVSFGGTLKGAQKKHFEECLPALKLTLETLMQPSDIASNPNHLFELHASGEGEYVKTFAPEDEDRQKPIFGDKLSGSLNIHLASKVLNLAL